MLKIVVHILLLLLSSIVIIADDCIWYGQNGGKMSELSDILINENVVKDLETHCSHLINKNGTTKTCCNRSLLHSLNRHLDFFDVEHPIFASCYLNVSKLFCDITCSSSQSSFVQAVATSSRSVHSRATPEDSYSESIAVLLHKSYFLELFNSCKVPAVNLIEEWYSFLGKCFVNSININFIASNNATAYGSPFPPPSASSTPPPSDLMKKKVINEVSQKESQDVPEEHCIWYGQCQGEKNCPYSGSAKSLDPDGQQALKKYCSHLLNDNTSTCCDKKQLHSLNTNLDSAVYYVYPEDSNCFERVRKLLCDISCAPSQSKFINVTHISKDPANVSAFIDKVSVFITKDFVQNSFNACKSTAPAARVTRMFYGGSVTDAICKYGNINPCSPENWLSYLGDVQKNSFIPFETKYIVSSDKRRVYN